MVLPKVDGDELGSAIATPALAILIQCYAAYALEGSGKEAWRRGVVRWCCLHPLVYPQASLCVLLVVERGGGLGFVLVAGHCEHCLWSVSRLW